MFISGQTFHLATGTCIETKSGALVTIAITGPEPMGHSEGTVIGIAYQGRNIIKLVSSYSAINVRELIEFDPVFKGVSSSVFNEIQEVIDNHARVSSKTQTP